MDDIRNEINIMSTLKHPNVISYFVSFIDINDLWLVMPLLESGSLEDIFQTKYKNGIKDEAMIATILKDVVNGLQYFHDSGQIHRDIKAQNVLMSIDGVACLSDFGVSAHIKTG